MQNWTNEKKVNELRFHLVGSRRLKLFLFTQFDKFSCEMSDAVSHSSYYCFSFFSLSVLNMHVVFLFIIIILNWNPVSVITFLFCVLNIACRLQVYDRRRCVSVCVYWCVIISYRCVLFRLPAISIFQLTHSFVDWIWQSGAPAQILAFTHSVRPSARPPVRPLRLCLSDFVVVCCVGCCFFMVLVCSRSLLHIRCARAHVLHCLFARSLARLASVSSRIHISIMCNVRRWSSA